MTHDVRAALCYTLAFYVVIGVAYYLGYDFDAGHVIVGMGISYYFGRRTAHAPAHETPPAPGNSR